MLTRSTSAIRLPPTETTRNLPASAHRLKLSTQFATRARRVPSRSDLRRWLKAALNRDAEITVRLVAESEARRLNRDYRGKDYAANVLAFVYEDGPALAGDIVLCVPIIAREAREQRKELTAHFAHLVIHGALHLQGYDHEREEEARQMEALESAILTGLGFADPYV